MKSNNLFIKSLEIEDLTCLDSYLKDIEPIKNIKKINFESPITFFVGENGSGKSTLLEAIALNYGFNSQGGSLNYNFDGDLIYSELYKFIKLTKGFHKPKDGFFFKSETLLNLATYIDNLEFEDMSEYGGTSLHEQSHGEGLFNLIKNRFRGNGLYILDEPETGLSPQRQLALIAIINSLLDSGSQFIIATHSPILASMKNSTILSFDGDEIHKISYKESELFKMTEMFINNTEYILNKIYNSK